MWYNQLKYFFLDLVLSSYSIDSKSSSHYTSILPLMVNILAHTSVLVVPVVVHHFMIMVSHPLMAPSHSKMCHAPKLKCSEFSVSWRWPWVCCSPMTSTVIRAQSTRFPLGCDRKRDWCHVHPFVAAAWCYMSVWTPKECPLIQYIPNRIMGKLARCTLDSGQWVWKTTCPFPQASGHSLTSHKI